MPQCVLSIFEAESGIFNTLELLLWGFQFTCKCKQLCPKISLFANLVSRNIALNTSAGMIFSVNHLNLFLRWLLYLCTKVINAKVHWRLPTKRQQTWWRGGIFKAYIYAFAAFLLFDIHNFFKRSFPYILWKFDLRRFLEIGPSLFCDGDWPGWWGCLPIIW